FFCLLNLSLFRLLGHGDAASRVSTRVRSCHRTQKKKGRFALPLVPKRCSHKTFPSKLFRSLTADRPVRPRHPRTHLRGRRQPWLTTPSGSRSGRLLLPRHAAADRAHECSALWFL